MIKTKPFYYLLKKIEAQVIKNRATKKCSSKSAKFFPPDKTVYNIEFYLMDAFEIYHFLPIYKGLLDIKKISAKFVCEPPEANTHGKWFDYETAINILNELNVEYSTAADPLADIVFSTQHIHILRKYKNITVNLQYGAGLNKTNFCSTDLATQGYDYRFVYSKYTTQKVEKYIDKKRIYQIGLPKHDDFFKAKVPKDNFDTTKPILTYFPTWDGDCSISLFYEELKKLKEDFFIITKAHHCTFRLKEKENDLAKIYNISDIVLEGNYDFAKSAILSDIILIDAKSGAATEVPYLNPNAKILYLSPRTDLKEYFTSEVLKLGYFLNKPEQLREKIEIIAKDDKYKKVRKKHIQYYMGSSDGNSTHRAVEAIKNIILINKGDLS